VINSGETLRVSSLSYQLNTTLNAPLTHAFQITYALLFKRLNWQNKPRRL